MPRPRSVPWVAIRIDFLRSEKVSQLPSTEAKLGFLSVLLEAKTLRRMGVFDTDRHFRAVMGKHGRYLPMYVSAGLVERAGDLCEKCRPMHQDADLKGDELIVHDYRRDQRDPTAPDRQERWRKGPPDEPENDGVNDGVRDGENDAERDGNQTPNLARALSLSLSEVDIGVSSPTGKGSGEGDAAFDLLLLVEDLTHRPFGYSAGSAVMRMLVEDARALTAPRVAEAYRAFVAESAGPLDSAGVVYGGHNLLYPFSRSRPSTPSSAKPKGMQPSAEEVRRAAG